MTNNLDPDFLLQKQRLRQQVNKRSDRLMDYFLVAYTVAALFFAIFYETWFMALSVSGILLLAYYSVKLALPKSDLYQYVMSAVLGFFGLVYLPDARHVRDALLCIYRQCHAHHLPKLETAATHAYCGIDTPHCI